MSKKTSVELRQRRHRRLRQKVTGTPVRPRLCVNRTLKHIHVQIIDDVAGKTLVSISTLQNDVATQIEGGKGSKAAARVIGTAIAEKAKAAGIDSIVFDHNGVGYHGVVQELAEAAREGGLEF